MSKGGRDLDEKALSRRKEAGHKGGNLRFGSIKVLLQNFGPMPGAVVGYDWYASWFSPPTLAGALWTHQGPTPGGLVTTKSDQDAMKVAVVGLGDVAHKAYLPVLAAVPDIDLHLVTRNRERLDRVGDAYRIANRHHALDELLQHPIAAAFVHAATDAHGPIVERLLGAGVDVYVDKPLADNLPDCARLVQLAASMDRSLMVGFNRRYAPAYAKLNCASRDLIVMEKHRRCLPAPPRKVVFDDFIHVVDTLRALLPGKVERTHMEVRLEGSDLHHVLLLLSGNGFTAMGTMSRMSGADEEVLEVIGGGAKHRIENMRDASEYSDDRRVITRGPDWRPATWVRGFDQICGHFLDAVRAGRRLDAADALRTHELCETITQHAEAQIRSSREWAPVVEELAYQPGEP